ELSDLKRLDWVTDGESSSTKKTSKERSLDDTNITLNPMQIRTFTVALA
ncbi:unnamed protein product, partial [Rotaria magnacalcarata]